MSSFPTRRPPLPNNKKPPRRTKEVGQIASETASAQGGGASSTLTVPQHPLSARILAIDVAVPSKFKDDSPEGSETAEGIVSDWIVPLLEATENVNLKYIEDTQPTARELFEKITAAKSQNKLLFERIKYTVHGGLKTQTFSNGGKRKRRKQTKKNKHKRK